MNYRVLVLLAWVLSSASFASIEEVTAPSASDTSLEIRRAALFRDGDIVKYGTCDVLEADCTPENSTLVVKRQIPYETYLRQLADRFHLPGQYVIHHEKGGATYNHYVELLTKTMVDQEIPEEERQAARTKIDTMISRAGVLDRFMQALAIKRALEWTTDEETAQEVHGSFELLTKLQKRFASPHLVPANSDYEAFLAYVALHASDEEVRARATRFLTKLQETAKWAPNVYKTSQTFTSAIMRGGPEASLNVHKLEEFFESSRIFRKLGCSIVEAHDSFHHYLPAYQESLIVKFSAVTADEFKANDWMKKVFIYEKSVRQYEQSLWPMNFVVDKTAGKDRAEELSTGRVWALGGTGLTYLEAHNACQKLGNGFHLPDYNTEALYSAPWLSVSSLGEQIPAVEGEKLFWLGSNELNHFKRNAGTARRMVSISYNTRAERDVTVYQFDYEFPIATLEAKPRASRRTVRTQEEEELPPADAIHYHGGKTPRAAALCVSEK